MQRWRPRTPGSPPLPRRLTVDDWLDEWAEGYVAGRVRPATEASYRQVVRLYIKPAIGTIPLVKLTPERVARMVRALEARGTLSPRTITYSLVVLPPAQRGNSGRAASSYPHAGAPAECRSGASVLDGNLRRPTRAVVRRRLRDRHAPGRTTCPPLGGCGRRLLHGERSSHPQQAGATSGTEDDRLTPDVATGTGRQCGPARTATATARGPLAGRVALA